MEAPVEQDRFGIVFVKLAEAIDEQAALVGESLPEFQSLRDEIDEIAELRQLVLETTEPEPNSFTST